MASDNNKEGIIMCCAGPQFKQRYTEHSTTAARALIGSWLWLCLGPDWLLALALLGAGPGKAAPPVSKSDFILSSESIH